MLMFNLIAALVMVIFSIYVCIEAVMIPLGLAEIFWVGAGAFPFIMGSLMLVLSVWWVIDVLTRMKKARQLNAGQEKKSMAEEVFGPKKQRRNLLLFSACVLVYAFVLIPLLGDVSRQYGFVLATIIFLTATFKLFNKISWVKAILIAVVTSVLIYLVFHYGLSVVMPT